jgi:hypothetical protein
MRFISGMQHSFNKSIKLDTVACDYKVPATWEAEAGRLLNPVRSCLLKEIKLSKNIIMS